jgi:hypothetical protein
MRFRRRIRGEVCFEADVVDCGGVPWAVPKGSAIPTDSVGRMQW